MSGIDDRLKEFYDGKSLSAMKVRKIQRKAARPRKLRFMFLGPIAAIIFIAVMGKIAFNFIKHDAPEQAVVGDVVTGFTVQMADSTTAASPVGITAFSRKDGTPAVLPGTGPDLKPVRDTYVELLKSSPKLSGTVKLCIAVGIDGGILRVVTLNRQWDIAASAVEQVLVHAVSEWTPEYTLPAGEYVMTVSFAPVPDT